MRVRVITLNCEGLQHGWHDQRCAAVIDGLAPLQPDVLCLQEVTVRHEERLYDQAAHIAEAVGLPYVAFDSYGEDDDVGTNHQDGLAIASRWPIKRVRARRLRDPRDARVVLLVRLEVDGGDLDVVTTHLAWREEDEPLRRRQAEVILDELTRNRWNAPGARAVLAGDFNATEDEPVIARASGGMQDAWRAVHAKEPGHTWSTKIPYTEGFDMPDRRLDYVFVPPGVRVLDAQIVLDRPAPVYPSDHFGLMVDLEWHHES